MKFHVCVKLLCGVVVTGGCSLLAIEPTFNLKNKSTDTIQIDIKQDNRSLTGLKSVAKDDDLELNLDTSKPTFLEIHVCPNIGQCYINDHDAYLAKVNAGKKIYLKFDGESLVPQKGSTKTGKTTQGHTIKNNVTKKDISVTKGTTKRGNSDIGRVFQQKKSQ
jgi:hypothetical protein